MPDPSEVLSKMTGIRKSFGHVEALRNINLDIGYNEIVALLGDNGAGKSTLIKIMTGVYAPDSGGMYWKGQKLERYNASKARDFGIETVFQDRALSEQHSVWKNVFMGREITNRWGFVDIEKEKQEAEHLMMRTMGFTSAALSCDAVVGRLSGGEKQGVAISRALYSEAELVILDEPTTGLSLSETKKVLQFIEKIKENGKSCIFISHNIYHVYPVVDRILIMDRGSLVGNFVKTEISLNELANKLYLVAQTGSLNGDADAVNDVGNGLSSVMP